MWNEIRAHAQGGAEGRPVVPRGARGGGGTSRLQPASRDASFGSGGASREPHASPPPQQQRPIHIGSNLRSGSFKFAQVSACHPLSISLIVAFQGCIQGFTL